MMEGMVYVAIDADDVGQHIGSAVINDDVDTLSSASQSINDGAQIFSELSS